MKSEKVKLDLETSTLVEENNRKAMDMFLKGLTSIPVVTFSRFFGFDHPDIATLRKGDLMKFISFYKEIKAMGIVTESIIGAIPHVRLSEGKREEFECLVEVYKL